MVLLKAEGFEPQHVAVESQRSLLNVLHPPVGVVCTGYLHKFSPRVLRSSTLDFIACQHLHASTVQRLPRRLSCPCPPLPKVGHSLPELVAREHDQIECLLYFPGASVRSIPEG